MRPRAHAGPFSMTTLGSGTSALNGCNQARSCKLIGGALTARSATKLLVYALIAAGTDWRRGPAGRSAALPLNQIAKALRQDQGGGAHLDDLDFASCDEKVEGTSTYAGKPTRIGNPHADGLDCKR